MKSRMIGAAEGTRTDSFERRGTKLFKLNKGNSRRKWNGAEGFLTGTVNKHGKNCLALPESMNFS